MQRATSIMPAGSMAAQPEGTVVLAHDERHLRRKLLHLDDGAMVMLDLKEPVSLANGDRLMLEDGTSIEVKAAEERLFDIRPRDTVHLLELAWHLGNRHLAAQIELERILIQRDHVIRDMLIGLGATVTEVIEPFQPVRGAYHAQAGHSHGHG